MNEAQKAGVIQFYDTHPINEHEILGKLAARGANLSALTEDELKDFDQDHYGGFEATDTLARVGDIRREHEVLDVCCGLGGPARWIAHRIGCKVTGLDLTQSRIDSARRLAARVGLDDLVDFVQGDATAMPLPDGRFDRVYGQEAWVHIPDKEKLLAECRRVMKTGGVLAFTDIVSRLPLTTDEAAQMASEMQFPSIVTADRYLEAASGAGFEIERYDDLSSTWKGILLARLEMYRSLKDSTIERFGEAHFEKWDRKYAAFVGLYAADKLGGALIVARAGQMPRCLSVSAGQLTADQVIRDDHGHQDQHEPEAAVRSGHFAGAEAAPDGCGRGRHLLDLRSAARLILVPLPAAVERVVRRRGACLVPVDVDERLRFSQSQAGRLAKQLDRFDPLALLERRDDVGGQRWLRPGHRVLLRA